jgi:hypothetical protein
MPDAKITPAAQRVIDQAEPRPGETLADACQRVATDALYETRNDGGMMHDAGAAAGEAARTCVARWLRSSGVSSGSVMQRVADKVQEGGT